MATNQIEISPSEGSETSVKSTSSVDPLSVKIVFKCHINRVCVIWESILLGRVDVSDRIVKMLSESTKMYTSMLCNGGNKLHKQLLTSCANSVSFLNLSIDLIAKITQGRKTFYY